MNKLIVMVGIPGSGKSTIAEKIARKENAVIISSDKLREEIFGDVWEMRKNRELFAEMYKRAFQYLSDGKNVILDATNTNRRQRKFVLAKFKPYYKECYYIKVPLSKALFRNMTRDRTVPEYAVKRYYNKLQEPIYSEGWNKINVVTQLE